jgi:hypothetical protein
VTNPTFPLKYNAASLWVLKLQCWLQFAFSPLRRRRHPHLESVSKMGSTPCHASMCAHMHLIPIASWHWNLIIIYRNMVYMLLNWWSLWFHAKILRPVFLLQCFISLSAAKLLVPVPLVPLALLYLLAGATQTPDAPIPIFRTGDVCDLETYRHLRD